MLKKILLAGFVGGSSLVSFGAGQSGAPEIRAMPKAEACNPEDYPTNECACGCCDFCSYYGNACNGCSY